MPWTTEALRQLLKEKGVAPFVTATLGSAIGTLSDYGLDELQIMAICEHLTLKVQEVRNNPAVISSLGQFVKTLED